MSTALLATIALALWTVAVTGLGLLAVRRPQSAIHRIIAALIVAPMIAFPAAVVIGLLGRPKPFDLRVHPGKAKVIGFREAGTSALYVWVMWPGEIEPTAYSMRWTVKRAREIEDAMREGHGEAIMKLEPHLQAGQGKRGSFSKSGIDSLADERWAVYFYPPPPPPPPEKQ